MKTLQIRWMIKADMPEIMRLEAACFGEFAWTRQEFADCLRGRNTVCLVAEDCETAVVLGYAIYEVHKNKIEVLNLAVDPQRHREGVGTALVNKLVGKLSYRRTRLQTVVRETNLAAQLFFRSLGWRAHVPVLKHYYDDTPEDAFRFVYRYREPAMPVELAAGAVA